MASLASISIEDLRKFQELTGVNPTIRRDGATFRTVLTVSQPTPEIDHKGMEQLKELLKKKSRNKAKPVDKK
jgi:hypothetical protein